MLSRKLLVSPPKAATLLSQLCGQLSSRSLLSHSKRLALASQSIGGQASSRSASAFARARTSSIWKQQEELHDQDEHDSVEPVRHGSDDVDFRTTRKPWEPDPQEFDGIPFRWGSSTPSLEELVRGDLPAARKLFNTKLRIKYRRDMRMWNKWAVMEWKAKNYDLARSIFRKASKISFHVELWQSWASMELEDRNYLEAKRLFKLVLATDPSPEDVQMAAMGLAQIEAAVGSLESARTMYSELVHKAPNDGNLLVTFARFEAHQAHNLLAARDLFRHACSLETASPKVWHAWAKAEFAHGKYLNARTVLQSGLKCFPKNQGMIELMANTHVQLGEVREARRLFTKVTTEASYFDPRCFNSFGALEEQLGNTSAAAELYRAVLQREPDSLSTITSLAHLTVKEHGIDDARRLWKKHSEFVTDHGQFCVRWGNFEENYGELTYAKKLYEDATRVQPRHIESWKALSRVEALLGDINAARSVLMMASQHCPADVPLLLQLAKVESMSHNVNGARRACEKALRVDPKRADAWNLRATLELPQQPERAKRLVQRALREIPSHEKKSQSILYCTLARALALMHQMEAAVEAFETSFQFSKTNWLTHWWYADLVLIPTAELDQAKRHLNLAIELAPRSKQDFLQSNLQHLEEYVMKATATDQPTDQMVHDSMDLAHDSHGNQSPCPDDGKPSDI